MFLLFVQGRIDNELEMQDMPNYKFHQPLHTMENIYHDVSSSKFSLLIKLKILFFEPV